MTTKALALENFWPAIFLKSRARVIKKDTGVGSLRLWLVIGLLAINAGLLMNYIYGVNQFTSEGYQITALQKRLVTLNEENSALNLKVSASNSMVAIQKDYLSANFVSAGTPKFLQPDGNLVSLNTGAPQTSAQ